GADDTGGEMKLREMLDDIRAEEVRGDLDVDITSVVYDSRRAVPGCLFTAVPGEKADGASFIGPAVEKGAAAVICERYPAKTPAGVAFVKVADARRAMALAAAAFYGQPSRRLGLVGITGTNGKTTASYLVRAVLESAGAGVGLIGTISYVLPDGRELPAPNTTPESVDLQRLLSEMADAGAGYCVMEVSSHAVALKRVAGCGFKARVFTNFTQDHLDFHGTMEEYYAAKKAFFTDTESVNVVNIDDPKGRDLAGSAKGRVITYGINNDADVTAHDIRLAPEGASFTLMTPSGPVKISSGLVGRHNIYNILSAAGACIALGMTPDDVARGIAKAGEVPGRLEKVEAGQDFIVLVDYAHTEDALERVLTAAREFTRGRLISVFGCGGDRDKTKRPKMGFISSRLSDITVLTSDNPRTEDPAEIMRQAEAGIISEGSKAKGVGYFAVPDRAEAIRFAVGMAYRGDTVLIAGKGHEDYQIIGDRKFHFDDRLAAREAILTRACA
ncbi:MAG TPA: UDP-N-acetylmuramoyl-L-alanyl-D-glutamate--2,6-diaminopimelate ligase, partial [Nitrospirota bacterium]|nr:UDP-N-acetylmuramoyl-L-alanyl-D-glutamate--2,6-diaminopimelate ligase [Nitrospirota bacterium]